MSYTPTVWKDGDVVTSARLNKIENAIEAIAETPGSSSFDFSDRMAKGVDDNGNEIKGAIIEGCIEDTKVTDSGDTFTITKNKATGMFAHAEGATTTASGDGSHAEGSSTTASGFGAHAEGLMTTASGDEAHAEGDSTTASGNYSHAEGRMTTASSFASHAEGQKTSAEMNYSHAEGLQTVASGTASHAEGFGTTASGSYSHAEGNHSVAEAKYSHAEGEQTTARGMGSHAEGFGAAASGNNSHAEGSNTIAKHLSQHVFGEFNIEDPSIASTGERGTYVEIVGNGSDRVNRSNARTLDWQGNERLAGSLTLGNGTNDVITISAAQLKNLLTPLIITETHDESTHVATLNMTWQQIYDAFVSGRKVLTFFEDSTSSYGPISYISFGDNIYIVDIDGVRYGCDTASGYPSDGNEVIPPSA